VNINGDTAVEANETFTASITTSSGASRLKQQATATILNDDGPTLSVGDASIVEGNSGTQTLSFPVTLSQPASAPVTVNVTTHVGTATAADLTGRTLTFNFAAGQTSKVFSVTVKGDTVVEPDENFFVNLSDATGPASILDSQGEGTIINDD
jgi:hypothetical protein